MAEQIPSDDYKKLFVLFVLDVRDAGQYGKDHIPGAVNIEWRKVFAQRGRLPRDKTIFTYCNTRSFSGRGTQRSNQRVCHRVPEPVASCRQRAG